MRANCTLALRLRDSNIMTSFGREKLLSVEQSVCWHATLSISADNLRELRRASLCAVRRHSRNMATCWECGVYVGVYGAFDQRSIKHRDRGRPRRLGFRGWFTLRGQSRDVVTDWCTAVYALSRDSMAGADEAQVVRCAYGCQDTACVTNNAGECNDGNVNRSVRSYRPHGSLARVLYDKRKADEWLAAYDKRRVSVWRLTSRNPRIEILRDVQGMITIWFSLVRMHMLHGDARGM